MNKTNKMPNALIRYAVIGNQLFCLILPMDIAFC